MLEKINGFRPVFRYIDPETFRPIDRPVLDPDPEFFSNLESRGLSPRQIDTIRRLHLSLACRLEREITSTNQVKTGWESVKALIPRVDESGAKWIVDRRVTSQWEERIKSRENSRRVSVYDKIVGWSSLPDKVKRHMVNHVMIALQFSDRCTTNCHFCGFADHGPITSLFSADSIKEYFGEFKRLYEKDNQKINAVPLYDASDPLDHPEFTDIYQAGVDILGPDFRFYVSTAVPLGSELELLRYFMLLENKKYARQHGRGLSPRISQTKLNAKRVDHLRKVIIGLHGSSENDVVEITSARDEQLRLGREDVWKVGVDKITLNDITGVSCADHVTMSPNGMKYKTLRLACGQFPNGEKKEPVITRSGSATIVNYPNHVYNSLHEPLPEIVIHSHSINGDGSIETGFQEMSDPLRTARKIATCVVLYNQAPSYKNTPSEYFRLYVTPADIRQLKQLVVQGNQSAQFLLGYLIHNRFISPSLEFVSSR